MLERLAIAEQFDRPFKIKALDHWKQYNNILPEPWPYYSRDYEPETQNTVNDTVESIMGDVFKKDTFFDLEPVEDQDEEQTEMMRLLMQFVLREKIKYKYQKYYQLQQAVLFGNGIEKHIVQPMVISKPRQVPVMAGDIFPVQIGTETVYDKVLECWPKTKIVDRFDCYPAPTGATIQEMPYFIERCIMPVKTVQAIAKYSGMKHTDELEGFFSLDNQVGSASGDWSERHFDLYERLAAVGYNVRGGNAGEASHTAVKYCEVLIYSEAPHEHEGCAKIAMVADRRFLLKAQNNPFVHGLKGYAEIKFQPRTSATWQAKGAAELIETQAAKLNRRVAQEGDIIEMVRAPMMLVGAGAQLEDLSDLDPYPGQSTRVGDVNQIKPLERNDVPGSIYRSIDFTRGTIQRSGGSLDYAKGVAGNSSGLSRGTETATGMSMLLQGANAAKTFKWLLAEETGITEGLNIIAANTQQVLSGEQKVRIIGENKMLHRAGWRGFLIVKPEDIAGRWHFYAVGASRSMDNAAQGELITKVVQGWMQLPDVAARVKQIDIATEAAEMAGMRNPQRFIMSDKEFQAKQQEAAQQGPQTPPIQDRIIETLAYKDLEPDVKAQILHQLGLQPSQLHSVEMAQAVADLHSTVKRNVQQPQPKQPVGKP